MQGAAGPGRSCCGWGRAATQLWGARFAGSEAEVPGGAQAEAGPAGGGAAGGGGSLRRAAAAGDGGEHPQQDALRQEPAPLDDGRHAQDAFRAVPGLRGGPHDRAEAWHWCERTAMPGVWRTLGSGGHASHGCRPCAQRSSISRTRARPRWRGRGCRTSRSARGTTCRLRSPSADADARTARRHVVSRPPPADSMRLPLKCAGTRRRLLPAAGLGRTSVMLRVCPSRHTFSVSVELLHRVLKRRDPARARGLLLPAVAHALATHLGARAREGWMGEGRARCRQINQGRADSSSARPNVCCRGFSGAVSIQQQATGGPALPRQARDDGW